MATAATNHGVEEKTRSAGVVTPLRPHGQNASSSAMDHPSPGHSVASGQEGSRRNPLQSLLAFAALHEVVRRRKVLESQPIGDDGVAPEPEAGDKAQFTLDDALQILAERAAAVTGADGLAIALAENNEIVLRAAAGTIRPDLGSRIDCDSTFSGACLRSAQTVFCDDAETDARVNLQACRYLGARSMIAVPLWARRHPIGLLQAFSAQPFGFDDTDERSLKSLAELVLAALSPQDEESCAASAHAAVTKLGELPNEPEAVPIGEAEKPVPKGHRVMGTGMLVLLLCMVIVSTLVGLMRWKRKPSQSVNGKVQTEEIAPKPKSTIAATKAPEPVAPVVGITSTAPPATPHPDEPSKGTKAANPPELRESSKFPMVTAIQHSSSADSSTVVLNLENQVRYDAHRLNNPDRIYFDLHDTQLPSDLKWKTFEVGDALLERIRVAQPVSGMTRVVLETTTHAAFSVNLERNPYRLVVELKK
jgi:putative methionine-R-sulfoxide reductase with GAF domain